MSLVVHLKQRSYVLPWSLFLYGEGDDGKVRATFHTHVVEVEGAGLRVLLTDMAEQMATEIREPDRTAKFREREGPHITAVSVRENK